MPAGNPQAGDVHVNVPLTNMSVAYIQDQSKFIADRVFPNISVPKQSDRYWTYSRADFNRDEMQERADGAESAGGGYDLDNTANYYASVYAYHKLISDRVRANEDTPLNSDRDAMQFGTLKGLIKRETLWASKFFKPGVWAYGEVGAEAVVEADEFLQWNDPLSTPIEDIRTAKRTIGEATGFTPNNITLGKAVYDALVDHPDIVDRVKYGQTPGAPAMANRNTLAQLFELDEVLVAEAIVNRGARGASYADSAANEDSGFILGNHALLSYRAPSPSLMMPSAGYTFSWTGYLGAQAMGQRIKKFRREERESDVIETQMAFDQKVVASDLGYFFENATHNPAS